MERRLRLWTVTAAGLLAGAMHAAAQSPLTLDRCIREALGRNPELEAQRYELKASTETVWKTRAILLPQLTGDIFTQTLNGSPTGPFSVLNLADADENAGGNRNGGQGANFDIVGTFTVRLGYDLYKSGSILGLNEAPAFAAAKAERTRQEWTYRITEQEVEYKLTAAFYNSICHQQQLESVKNRVSLAEQRLAIVKSESELGLKLPKDVEWAEAHLTADRQALASTKHQAWESRAVLAALLGRNGETLPPLDSSEPRMPNAPELPDLLKTATRSHPAVGAQQAAIEVTKQNWQRARSERYPSVRLESAYTEATDFRHTDADLFIAGVRVEVPIFDFGLRQAATRESRNKMLAAQARMGQVEDDLRVSLIGAVGGLHRIESKLAGLQRDYGSAKSKVTLLETQRELGMVDQLSLVEAKLELLTLSEALNLQKLAQRLQFAYLQNATGGYWKWRR